MIIDAHVHIGKCQIFNLDICEKEIIESMEKNQIDISIIQPLPGAPDSDRVHSEIYKLTKKYPKKIYGLVNYNPRNKDFIEKVKIYKFEYGFVGIKVHTFGHSVAPNSEYGYKIFDIANEYNWPVMVHTGPGIPFSLPSLCIECAQKYPNINVILAHSGFAIFGNEAILSAKMVRNIYLETSSSSCDDLKVLVEEVGSDRVMFGSDLPIQVYSELAKVNSTIKDNLNKDNVFYKTAKNIFNISN